MSKIIISSLSTISVLCGIIYFKSPNVIADSNAQPNIVNTKEFAGTRNTLFKTFSTFGSQLSHNSDIFCEQKAKELNINNNISVVGYQCQYSDVLDTNGHFGTGYDNQDKEVILKHFELDKMPRIDLSKPEMIDYNYREFCVSLATSNGYSKENAVNFAGAYKIIPNYSNLKFVCQSGQPIDSTFRYEIDAQDYFDTDSF